MPLAAPTEYGADLRMIMEKFEGAGRPGWNQLAVAIDELDKGEFWFEFHKSTKAGVSGPGRGKAAAHVEFDNIDALAFRPRHGIVGGTGIDVNEPFGAARGLKAALQPFALVAADRDDPVGRTCIVSVQHPKLANLLIAARLACRRHAHGD